MNSRILNLWHTFINDLPQHLVRHDGFAYRRPLSLFALYEKAHKAPQQPVCGVNSRVTIYLPDSDEHCTLTLVSPSQADSDQLKVSLLSPLGQALVGKTSGEAGCAGSCGLTVPFRLLQIHR